MSALELCFLLFAGFCLLVVVTSSLQIRRPAAALILPLFAFGLATTELAWFFLLLQAAIGAVFIGLGAIAGGWGKIALVLLAASCLGLWRIHRQSHAADLALEQALSDALGRGFRDQIPASRQMVLRDRVHPQEWLRPFSMQRPGVTRVENIPYGEAGERNLLDIYVPSETRQQDCPVLLQIHGGAWYSGHKQQQAQPLLNHMAQRGWVCVSINYRLSPQDRFPAHIVDVKKAISWIRRHIATYGGNPAFLAVTGGSAGGHLAALAGLSANDPRFQPGFEQDDTNVDAVVPMYGVYDFCDFHGKALNLPIRNFLADKVMPGPRHQCEELWHWASPIRRVKEEAPPFFIIHGDRDVMTSWELANDFANELRRVSQQPVAYAELAGAQHGFDGMHSIRTGYLLNHVAAFLEWAHARKRSSSQPAEQRK